MTGDETEPAIQVPGRGLVAGRALAADGLDGEAGIYVVDLDGTLLSITPRFAEIFGYAPSAMSGRPIFDFIVDREKDARRAAFTRLARGETPSVRTDGTYLRADGSEVALFTQSTLTSTEIGTFVIGVVADETARLHVERAALALRALGSANAAMVRAASETELLQALCDIALSTGAYAAAYIGYAEHDDLRTVRAVARAGGAVQGLDEIVVRWDESANGRGPTGTAIRTGAPVIVRDIQSDPALRAWGEYLRRRGIQSMIALPLAGTAGVFGCLTLSSTDPKAFDQDEVALLVQLAGDISFGVASVRNRVALGDAERRYREHAARLEVLWNIVSRPGLSDDEIWTAMLTEATAAIRPGAPYLGLLFRVRGDEIVVDACAQTPEYDAEPGGGFPIGTPYPLAGTAVEQILEHGGTQTWEDLHDAFPHARIQRFAWRSSISTIFTSGPSKYVLWFVSTTNTGAWSAQDRAYVEVVSAFFASRAQMRWQFDQLQYQQTHDVLTGLLNRSQFRSRARMSIEPEMPFAVVVVDVNDFSDVNETYGNMIGDALLVEVAAGIAERTTEAEIVGRLSGDVFAVFIPNPRSREYVRDRAIHFAERFRQGFGTGDRAGKEFVALTASLGIALAPGDGNNVDTIIARATTAVAAARIRGPGSLLFYEAGMEGDAQRNITFRNDITEAVASDQSFYTFSRTGTRLRGKRPAAKR
jgi:diguanylate cyclase (GGDEF)-like protein/PAS domain S-box-containing protein